MVYFLEDKDMLKKIKMKNMERMISIQKIMENSGWVLSGMEMVNDEVFVIFKR